MVNCLTDEEQAGLADGSIAGPAREALEAHLAGCSKCRSEVRALVASVGAGGPAAPGGLAGRILARLPLKEGRTMRFRTALFVAAAAAVLAGLAVWLGMRPTTQPRDVAQPNPVVPILPAVGASLGGDDRFLAHLSTDKPLYRPGERFFARAVILNGFSRKPAEKPLDAVFEIRSARGEKVAEFHGASENGVAALGWEIPRGAAGGTYTLVAKFPSHGFPDAEMTFDVRSYRVPRLRTDLQFVKKAYGPGEEVTAVLGATRAEGGIPAGAAVTAVATVDAKEVFRGSFALDARGGLTVRFRLPEAIEEGNGTLSLAIRDGGVQETAAKSIPILLNRLAVDFYPEGGDLVAGVEGRVYFEARNTKKDPADISGRVVDEAGREVARFESLHEGRGRFAFTPRSGARYRAVIDRPAGIPEAALPEVRGSGVSLVALDERTAPDQPVRVRLAAPEAQDVTIGVYLRDRELARGGVRLSAGNPVDVSLSTTAHGVLRVTVFDMQGTPRAERLVFRGPESGLRIALEVDPKATVPGGKVTVKVKTTDETGKPVAAVVGLSAADDAVLSTIDPRDRAPRLPAQALLGAEVKEFKDAQAYLGADARSALRTDLLLGTQGWRRFAFVEPSQFIAKHGAAARRALAHRAPVTPDEALDLALVREEARLGEVVLPPEPPKAAAPLPAVAAQVVPDAKPDPEPPPVEGERKGEKEGLLKFRIAGALRPPAPPPPVVRVYAHARAAAAEGARTDFTETIYWHAGLATDAKGEASFSFQVSDSITTFRLRADGFAREGALGEADGEVEVRRPFYVEPKFPLEVTAGDRIELPIALVNGTDAPLAAKIEASVGKGLRILEGGSAELQVPAGSSIRTVLAVAVEPHRGEVEIRLRSQAGPHQDDVTRKIAVVPSGFPIELAFGGLLERVCRHEVAIPEGLDRASLVAEAKVYPSPLAALTEALGALLREPHGCFEQTSSTNYPNVMALQYMKSHSGVDPRLIARAQDLVEKGYKRLVSFECSKKGYEWFGSDPGHEALTAYGVLEFVDMSRIMSVDISMVDRTRRWLLSRRDGKGGFLRDPKALDSFGRAPQDVTDAYILWALTEAGEQGLEKEIAALKAAAAKSEDPYLLALAANVFLNTGDRAAAEAALDRVAQKQEPTGRIPGARTSITGSGGESLEIETASLAILGWLRSPKHTASSEKAMRWLVERCKAGRFGSTQSTILALRAIIAYDAAHARPKKAGKVVLKIDGKGVAEQPFPADQQGPIALPDFAAALTPGRRVLEISMEEGADMPYSLHIQYHARTPASSPACKVGLRTSLSRVRVAEGEAVDVAVEVVNRTKEGLPMVTAIVGLPGGLEARADQLKELVREGKVDAFEARGRDVILYWRGLAPQGKAALTLSCVASVPGAYEGAASRAYLYYADEHKDWQDGLRVQVASR